MVTETKSMIRGRKVRSDGSSIPASGTAAYSRIVAGANSTTCLIAYRHIGGLRMASAGRRYRTPASKEVDMTYTEKMLDAYPAQINLDHRQLAAVIDALESCAQACTACADACLSEPAD